MNRKQDAEQISILFQSAFNREKYAHFLRNFAVHRLQLALEPNENGLFAFYAKEDNDADWRFSCVKIDHSAKFDDNSGKLEKELTPAKRYSFLLGEHENSHAAQAQLIDLLAMDYPNPA